MKQVSLSDEVVMRLKQLAEPLEDSYDSVISRLLDVYETQESCTPTAAVGKKRGAVRINLAQLVDVALSAGERAFDPFSPPDLTHTKLTSARVNGTTLINPNWNRLLDEILCFGRRSLGSFSALRKISPVNMVEGRKTTDGYHFLSADNFSVQGQDANDAWKCIAHIAQQLGCEVEVHFVWRLKEGAAHPGIVGRFFLHGRT